MNPNSLITEIFPPFGHFNKSCYYEMEISFGPLAGSGLAGLTVILAHELSVQGHSGVNSAMSNDLYEHMKDDSPMLASEK